MCHCKILIIDIWLLLCVVKIIIMKRQIKTTLKQIIDYWIENNNIDETKLNFDWSDANTHCWNCGDDKYRNSIKKASLERCHIIPHSLGGYDVPSNYVLLCKECHSEAPNISNNNNMWDWIKSNYMPISLYGTYRIRKALVMFKQKEGYSFFDKAKDIKDLNKVYIIEFKKISTHVSKITITTYYYMFKSIINNYT